MRSVTMYTASVRAPAAMSKRVCELDLATRSYQQLGRVLVCQGKKCSGGADMLRAASALVGCSPGVDVRPVKCVGRCSSGGCALRVKVEGKLCAVYEGLDASSMPAIMDAHFMPAAAAKALVGAQLSAA